MRVPLEIQMSQVRHVCGHSAETSGHGAEWASDSQSPGEDVSAKPNDASLLQENPLFEVAATPTYESTGRNGQVCTPVPCRGVNAVFLCVALAYGMTVLKTDTGFASEELVFL